MTLNPMQVIVEVKEGESLKLGIRTSNYKPDGTRSTNDNHGWFKVDHFRIHKVTAVDDATKIKGLTSSVSKGEGAVYDLSGRKVDSIPSSFGGLGGNSIYIVNGRKVLF